MSCSFDDSDSVILQVPKITPYLDRALKALGLDIETRTSFITYWLPDLLKHEHVALRFVPQAAHSRAAPMDVNPIPDVCLWCSGKSLQKSWIIGKVLNSGTMRMPISGETSLVRKRANGRKILFSFEFSNGVVWRSSENGSTCRKSS
ncbi:hypothetical protein CPB85DRAFT_205284 [Mucidula mucida]|nr:hypothetical protein CPB85DRAFT_205284 [Mucidula mucida]